MKENKNVQSLTDADLEKVSGGCDGEDEVYVMLDMVCEFGHTWEMLVSANGQNQDEIIECPECFTRNVRRKN